MRKSPLIRRTPLRQVSLKRTAIRSTPRYTGPDRATVEAVCERDGWLCAIRGCHITGVMRGVDFSLHHRRPRGAGGTTAADANLPSNMLLVCGSGTSGCHGWIESNRADAYGNGWILRQGTVPSQEPVLHALHGWVYLTDDARVELVPPPILRASGLDLGGYWADEDGVA